MGSRYLARELDYSRRQQQVAYNSGLQGRKFQLREGFEVAGVAPGPEPGIMSSRPARLFLALAGLFLTNALMAEFIGVKIFALEDTLGLPPFGWQLFGQSGSLSFTAGVMLWPIVFVMTDVINEHYGVRGVRLVSWLAVGFISYAFVFAYLAIALAPAGWWVTVGAANGVPDMQAAFASIFGQGLWTIGGSITAFLIGQLIDVAVFHWIRRRSGERWIWLRATGSTAVSQLVDSFVVLYIAFVLGPQQWPISLFLAVGTVNYGYKMMMAVALIPLLYLARWVIRAYLGDATSAWLRAEAALSRSEYSAGPAGRPPGPRHPGE